MTVRDQYGKDEKMFRGFVVRELPHNWKKAVETGTAFLRDVPNELLEKAIGRASPKFFHSVVTTARLRAKTVRAAMEGNMVDFAKGLDGPIKMPEDTDEGIFE